MAGLDGGTGVATLSFIEYCLKEEGVIFLPFQVSSTPSPFFKRKRHKLGLQPHPIEIFPGSATVEYDTTQ